MTKSNPELINKCCDVCGQLIVGKRVRAGRKDGLYRCNECQGKRNRVILTVYMKAALKGKKSEQYKTTRNSAKIAWEVRNPEGRRARAFIKSIRSRLRKYGFDLDRFVRPSTRALAGTIMQLPKYCVNCNIDDDLTIQHIKAVVDYPELALEPTNLTTLCRSCNTKDYHHA